MFCSVYCCCIVYNAWFSSTRKAICLYTCAEGLQNTDYTNIKMEVDSKVKSLKLDMRARHEFLVIFKEALQSIAEHTNGSPTIINVDLSSGKLSLKIQNSDVNLSDVEQGKKEMMQRAKLINAELNMQ